MYQSLVAKSSFLQLNSHFGLRFTSDYDILAAAKLNKAYGEYNFMQHGIRSTKIDNSLVRSPEQAVSFSRYFMDKNNAVNFEHKLAERYKNVHITKFSDFRGVFFRVRVGKYRVYEGRDDERVVRVVRIRHRREVYR